MVDDGSNARNKNEDDKMTPLSKTDSAKKNTDKEGEQLPVMMMEIFQKTQEEFSKKQVAAIQHTMVSALESMKESMKASIEEKMADVYGRVEKLIHERSSDLGTDTARQGQSKTRATTINMNSGATNTDSGTGNTDTQDERTASTVNIPAQAKLEAAPRKLYQKLWKNVSYKLTREEAISYVKTEAEVPVRLKRTRTSEQPVYYQCLYKCGYEMRIYYDKKTARWFVAETEDVKEACKSHMKTTKKVQMKSKEQHTTPGGGQGIGIKDVKDCVGTQRAIDSRLKPTILQLKEEYPKWGGGLILEELKRLLRAKLLKFDGDENVLKENMLPDSNQVQVSFTYHLSLSITDISSRFRDLSKIMLQRLPRIYPLHMSFRRYAQNTHIQKPRKIWKS